MHDMKQIESRCKTLTHHLKELADETDFNELMTIIHKPGWTTVAEFQLVNAVLDSMTAQAKHLADLKHALMAGARAVAIK